MVTGIAAMAVVGALGLPPPAGAADQGAPREAAGHYRARHSHIRAARDCTCCGCWHPQYVRHRQILYTYPSDPRYTLSFEPRYVRGPVRTYLHNLLF
jgi:hypothetical protein